MERRATNSKYAHPQKKTEPAKSLKSKKAKSVQKTQEPEKSLNSQSTESVQKKLSCPTCGKDGFDGQDRSKFLSESTKRPKSRRSILKSRSSLTPAKSTESLYTRAMRSLEEESTTASRSESKFKPLRRAPSSTRSRSESRSASKPRSKSKANAKSRRASVSNRKSSRGEKSAIKTRNVDAEALRARAKSQSRDANGRFVKKPTNESTQSRSVSRSQDRSKSKTLNESTQSRSESLSQEKSKSKTLKSRASRSKSSRSVSETRGKSNRSEAARKAANARPRLANGRFAKKSIAPAH